MNKRLYLIVIIFTIIQIQTYCQEPLWKQADNYEKKGNYLEAIRLKKVMAQKDNGTEWYIDDIASIARCYSYINNIDSTRHYCKYLIQLAEQLINNSDSIAEEYLQSAVWSYYRCNQYTLSIYAAEKILELRKQIYGLGAPKYLEWLGVMSFNSFKAHDYDRLKKYCQLEVDIAEQLFGMESQQFENAISSICGYAHQLVDDMPLYINNWIYPYYTKLLDANILPQFQYEFEILLLEGYHVTRNLQSANTFADKLEKWIYCDNNSMVPLEDKVRILLKLAYHYLQMGNNAKSRIYIDKAWKSLSNEKVEPSMAQLVDRHIIERELRFDSLGRSMINADWIIKSSTSIIESGNENAEIVAFFYESRAWAYEGLDNYENAISDIKNSIRLKPTYGRKKKLGQLYLHNKQYDLAEIQILDIYNDSTISDQNKKEIQSDLIMLYWLCGNVDLLEKFLVSDFDNMKSEVRHAFTFMNDVERETYLSRILLGGNIKYDFYTGYSNNGNQWVKGNIFAYNMALVQKGLLLSTYRDISKILKSAPDSLQRKIRLYEKANKLSLPTLENDIAKETRIALMRYVSEQPDFLNQLNYTWHDVRNRLEEGEVAIEFVNIYNLSPQNIKVARPGVGALIVKKDSDFPFFVQLASNSQIDSLYTYDDDGNQINDEIYKGETKLKLYKYIWKPIEQYLKNINTVYYSPAGYLHNINLDWIGESSEQNLIDNYNLYRLSSTRELCQYMHKKRFKNSTLYGDISYSNNVPIRDEIPITRNRNITRSGFSSLKGTAIEIDSICMELKKFNYNTSIITKKTATEETLRNMSGKSPEILHFATHGFYYSKEAAKKQYDYGGGFIAFQSDNTELFRSGLALSGAQDTWNIKDIEQYIQLDQTNDGILLSAEISHLDLTKTDLVVLSACETALGNITSEGVYGLQRAFKLAGVNSIIMSLWKVDDDATQIFMTTFYKNFLSGKSKRESLKEAQMTVKSTLSFEDPYYWAGFILLDGLN